MNTACDSSGWSAALDLGFKVQGDRTILAHRAHHGPLMVQKPFYPEGHPCHVYILHPPGGIVGGDQLDISTKIHPSAHAVLTTPAASKFYRSAGIHAKQKQHLHIAKDAALEWLPQETILFSGCYGEISTRVDLSEGARFIGWEVLCLGRPSCGETFGQGDVRHQFELWRDNQPIFIERTRFQGGSPIFNSQWGLVGQPVMGTMILVPVDKKEFEQLRNTIKISAPTLFSVTLLGDVLVCRFLGNETQQARKHFTQVWEIMRPKILDRPHCPPRIWYT